MVKNNKTYYASLTVALTNNTAQGAITFGLLSFSESLNPSSYPPVIINTVVDGDTQTILIAASESIINYSGTPPQPVQGGNPVTEGFAVFNLPNGDTLQITWDLDADDASNSMPSIVPSSDYYSISGLTNPVVKNNYYTFNIVVGAPQQ